MTRKVIHNCLTASAFALLAGCNRFSLDTYWRSERYVLLAIDARGQMCLSFDRGGGTSIGLVGPTVFSIGVDERYIVLMQHPGTDAFGAFDRSITNYFVVERTTSPSLSDRKKGVRGPLTKEEFEKLASSSALPGFTKTFDDLK